MTSRQDIRKTRAAIHIIKKALGLDEDAYRDALAMQFDGRRSSTLLNDAELKRWLLHLKSLQQRAGLNTTAIKNAEMVEKLESLWITLRKLGAVRDGSKDALQVFVRNQTGAAGLRMASSRQLVKAIEALKKWEDRAVEQNRIKHEKQEDVHDH